MQNQWRVDEAERLAKILGGPMLPGEGVKGCLRQVCELSGIGYASAYKAWFRTYASKETLAALRRAIRNDGIRVAIDIERAAHDLAANERFSRHVDVLLAVANQLRSADACVRSGVDSKR